MLKFLEILSTLFLSLSFFFLPHSLILSLFFIYTSLLHELIQQRKEYRSRFTSRGKSSRINCLKKIHNEIENATVIYDSPIEDYIEVLCRLPATPAQLG